MSITWRRFSWLCLLLLVCLFGLAPGAVAGERVVIDLETAIEKALVHSPEIKEAQAAELFASARRDEAKAWFYPQIEVTGLFGPAPGAEGDQVYSPTSKLPPDYYTVFGRLDMLIMQPLYTFGRLTESLKAAESGLKVERAGLRLKKAEVVLKVKEFYYGLQLAIESQAMVDEFQGYLTSAHRRAEKLLAIESPSVSEMDLAKAEAYEGQLAGLKAQAEKGVALAQTALAAACGMPGAEVWPAETYLEPPDIRLENLDSYQNSSLANRPEMRQLKEGLAALDSLVKVAEAEQWPLFFLAGQVSLAYSPGRDWVNNPYIDDPFRRFVAGGALGARWEINFGITQSKIAQARADALKLKAKEAFARTYLPVEVAQAYLEVAESEKRMAAAKKGYNAARTWLISASTSYDFGLGSSQEIFDALEKYATQKAEYYMALHNIYVGWARLFKAAGLDNGPEVNL